jgi:peroxiredoxin
LAKDGRIGRLSPKHRPQAEDDRFESSSVQRRSGCRGQHKFPGEPTFEIFGEPLNDGKVVSGPDNPARVMHTRTDFPLPPDLPRPIDDGASDHLVGMLMPQISLPSTAGRMVDLSNLGGLRTVIYCYPMTGVPGKPLPEGWDMIPGARGCTPETCGFRDHHQALLELRAGVFGLSTQTTEYQQEMASRLRLPFEILSDAQFRFRDSLSLPTFTVEGVRLLKRLTLIVRDGRIEHDFYPVFPPNENAAHVMRWLRDHPIPADPVSA